MTRRNEDVRDIRRMAEIRSGKFSIESEYLSHKHTYLIRLVFRDDTKRGLQVGGLYADFVLAVALF